LKPPDILLNKLTDMTTVLESLNRSLHRSLGDDKRIIVIGEDILDPYGGAFKVTRGLSEKYPDQVISTPISEAGIVGIAAGMAMRGLLPIVEIMFGDFLTLAADQIINHAVKFRWMYNEKVKLPLVIRTPMGGRRGYGPTHSQTLEKLFLGVPGLNVLAPCSIGEPGELLFYAIKDIEDPVLFIENKLLYPQPVGSTLEKSDFRITTHKHENQSQKETITNIGKNSKVSPPTFSIRISDAPKPTLSIAAYGFMSELALQAIHDLAYQHEVFCELVVPTWLVPWSIKPFLSSCKLTGKLLVIEEGTLSLGWGAEIVSRVSEILISELTSVRRLAALEYPIPGSEPLESAMLPGIGSIKEAAIEMEHIHNRNQI
jgi:pyruvate/2-oxoglutarate/acetoin dehydrogenase E1 component